MNTEFFGYNEKVWSDEEWLEVRCAQFRLPRSWRIHPTLAWGTCAWSPRLNSYFAIMQPIRSLQSHWLRFRNYLLPRLHEIPSHSHPTWFQKIGPFGWAVLPDLLVHQQHRRLDEDQAQYFPPYAVKFAYRKQLVEQQCHHRITIWSSITQSARLQNS